MNLPQMSPFVPCTVFDIPFSQKLGKVYEEAPTFAPTAALNASYRIFQKVLFEQFTYVSQFTRFEFTESDPYGSFTELYKEYVNRKVVRIFSAGEDANKFMTAKSPIGGLSYNLIFRAVHDILGHCAIGAEFTPMGEENAVRSHASYFPEQCRLALFLETRAQNAWTSYGPHLNTVTAPNSLPLQADGGIIFPENKLFELPAEFLTIN